MNTKLVDTLLETVFFGGEEGGLEDQPHPRFKLKPPGEEAADVPPASPPPEEPGMPDDRTGSVSMSQMLPKEEIATTDDLIDFFAKIRKAKGKTKKAWEKEFAAHRTEFESRLRAFVDKLLTETVCDVCGQEVGDRFFADKSRSGKKTNVCGSCYMKQGEGNVAEEPGYYHAEDPGEYAGSDVPKWEQARLGRQQSRRMHKQPPITPFP